MIAPPRLIALDDADFDDVVVPITATTAAGDTRGPPGSSQPVCSVVADCGRPV
jgi:hypothetical protein